MKYEIDATDPMETARFFLRSLDSAEWPYAAALVDERDLQEWFAEKTRDRTYHGRQLTIEDMRKQDPDMPLVAAEYQLAQTEKQLERRGTSLHGDFGNITTVEELLHVPPREALALHLEMLDPAARYAFETGRKKPELGGRREPLTCVRPRDGIAYVLYEKLWGPESSPEDMPHVLALRHEDAGWRIRIRGEAFEHAGYTLLGSVEDTNVDEAAVDQHRTGGA